MSNTGLIELVVLYYIPFWIAALRRHPNESGIFILNTLIGWTIVGWFVALIMACGTVQKKAA